MNKFASEFIGTFALVFAGCGAIMTNVMSDGALGHSGVALTFGLVVMAMIYAVGDISGAHFNPAVTLGFWLARRFPGREVTPFVLSQLAGAAAAAGMLKLLFGDIAKLGSTLPSGPVEQSFGLEVLLTAGLVFVILSVAIGSKETGILAGVAIGGTVAMEAMFGGPISGASMNPARSLGPALVSGTFEHQWLYVVAPVLGAAIGVSGWHLTGGKDRVAPDS
ncbi:MAG: MIP family channel protein [Myxococcota bacterium]